MPRETRRKSGIHETRDECGDNGAVPVKGRTTEMTGFSSLRKLASVVSVCALVATIGAVLGAPTSLAATSANAFSWSTAQEATLPADAYVDSSTPGGQSASLAVIRCPTSTTCVAVGTYLTSTAGIPQQAMVVSVTNGVPSAVNAVTLPDDASANPAANLSYLQCPSASFCVAAGNYTDTSGGTEAMIVSITNGVPAPASEVSVTNFDDSAFHSVDINALDCPSATSCLAVGQYADSTANPAGANVAMVVPITEGAPAAAIEVTLPSNAATSFEAAALVALACPAASSCVAIGGYADDNGASEGMVVPITSGVPSTATEVSLPSGSPDDSSQEVYYNALTCSSTTSCVAVGFFKDSNAADGALVVPITNGAPTTAVEVIPTGFPDSAGESATLTAIECPSAASCVAVGTYTDASSNTQATVVSIVDGAPITADSVTLPSDATPGTFGNQQGAQFNALACPDATSCIAVGQYVDTYGGNQAMSDEITNGVPSSASEIALPSDAFADTSGTAYQIATLTSVVCPSSSVCLGGGDYADADTGNQAMLTTVTAGAPAPATVTLPTDGYVDTTNNGNQNATIESGGIACPSVSSCLAIGTYKDTFIGQQTMIVDGTLPSAPPPSGIPTAALGTPVSASVSSGSTTTLTSTQATVSATISVPPGALPAGTIVTAYPVVNSAALTSDLPTDQPYVASFVVSWQAPDGTTPAASAAITMTITDPSIVTGDVVYELSSSALTPVGTATQKGSVTITFTSDPAFIVAGAAPPSAVLPSAAALSLHRQLARIRGDTVTVQLSCASGQPCHALVRLFGPRHTLRRRHNVITHDVLASKELSLRSGQTKAVALEMPTVGRLVIARPHPRLALTLVTILTGLPRQAHSERVYIAS